MPPLPRHEHGTVTGGKGLEGRVVAGHLDDRRRAREQRRASTHLRRHRDAWRRARPLHDGAQARHPGVRAGGDPQPPGPRVFDQVDAEPEHGVPVAATAGGDDEEVLVDGRPGWRPRLCHPPAVAGRQRKPVLRLVVTEVGRAVDEGGVEQVGDLAPAGTGHLSGDDPRIVEHVAQSEEDAGAGGPRRLDAFPQLGGYVVTTAKPGAEVYFSSPKQDPVLAAGSYGLGRTVAWTSDSTGHWTGGFLRSRVSGSRRVNVFFSGR